MYTQADFKADIEAIEGASQGKDGAAIFNALQRGRTLMTASGEYAAVVCGDNRMRLQRALGLCESIMASGGPQQLPLPLGDQGVKESDNSAGHVDA
jgi:hypothetical protein